MKNGRFCKNNPGAGVCAFPVAAVKPCTSTLSLKFKVKV